MENQQQELKKKMHESPMELDIALSVVGAKSEFLNDPDGLSKIFGEFVVSHWAKTQEGDTAFITKQLVPARHTLAETNLKTQIHNIGKFEIPKFEIDDEGWIVCPECSGLGQRIKFARRVITVGCNKCQEGTLELFSKKVIDGDRLEISRKIAEEIGRQTKDEHHYFMKCPVCSGTSKVKLTVLDFAIESVTPCKKCNEIGILEKPLKPVDSRIPKTSEPGNPVMTVSLGEKVKESLKDTPAPEEKILGDDHFFNDPKTKKKKK